MDKPETFVVTKDNELPNGKPGECFYCNEKIGTPHKPECVNRVKTVVVDFAVRLVVSVPQSWNKDDIEFKYNESSWCAGNLVDMIGSITDDDHDPCTCANTIAKYVSDATESEESLYGVVQR